MQALDFKKDEKCTGIKKGDLLGSAASILDHLFLNSPQSVQQRSRCSSVDQWAAEPETRKRQQFSFLLEYERSFLETVSEQHKDLPSQTN